MKSYSDIPLIRAYKSWQEPECARVFADSFWSLLLTLCVLLTMVAIGYDVWQFSDVDRVLSAPPPSASPAADRPLFDRAQLQAVIDGYAQRQVTYELYSSHAPAIPDPSATAKTTGH